MRILLHLLISACAVLATAYLLPGVEVAGLGTALGVAVLLAVVTALVAPVIGVLTIPVNVMTLGLFTFVILGVCVKIVDGMLGGFYVSGFGAAIAFAAVVALIDGAFEGAYRRLAHHHA